MNVNIKKFIQKEILARKFMTSSMATFMFDDFVLYLNDGLVLKDSNAFTLLSKNNEIITEFYSRYFENESVNLS